MSDDTGIGVNFGDGSAPFNYWGTARIDRSENGVVIRDADSPIVVRGQHRQRLAALCLYGQPFGFDTEADDLNVPAATIVEALRDTADAIDAACGNKMIGIVTVSGPGGRHTIGAYYSTMFRACAARISALLPPSESEATR